MTNTVVIVEYKVMDILAICQKIKKKLWHFEISVGVNGKPKMWNISKTADRKARKKRKFGTRGATVHKCRVF